MTRQALWTDLEKIREVAPLVHNITNYVVMNNTANALLAIGASPVMAHAREEVAEMSSIASALVINIGTLSPDWVEAMTIAMATAAQRGIPIIFDPVGAGATSYRTGTCHSLLQASPPSVIRGNASEIMALVDASVRTKGVDSAASEGDAQQAARDLARHYSCVVVVSGATDLVTDGEQLTRVPYGHPLMARITGMGCTATALIGAFAAVNRDLQRAAANSMAVLGISGSIAARQATGPGSLQMALLDILYNLDEAQLAAQLPN